MVKHWVVMVGVLCAACGGGDGSGEKLTGESGLLQQAPRCPVGGPSFYVQGTLDGVAIEDKRGDDNSNVGLVNIGSPSLDTPFSSFATLAANQLELHLTWQASLFFGQTAASTGATLVPPATHPRAGQTLCVSTGTVGFVDGGSEDGSFKFRITGARGGSDCSLEIPVDLRGCLQ